MAERAVVVFRAGIGQSGRRRRLLAAQKNAYGKMNADPAQLAREIFKEYGFNVGDAPDAEERKMAQLMSTPAARGMAGRVLESRRTLSSIAGGRDADKVSAAYFQALKSGDKADMEAFRNEYGLADAETFGRFETALQFQQQTGLLSVGGKASEYRTKNERSALTQLYSDAVRGGARVAEPQSSAGTGKVEVTGKVKLEGDVLNFTEVWGSSRAFTPGGP